MIKRGEIYYIEPGFQIKLYLLHFHKVFFFDCFVDTIFPKFSF